MVKKHTKKYRTECKMETYLVTKKIYNFLKNNPGSVFLKKIHGGNLYGYYEEETEEIYLDYRMPIIPTLIHECLHHFYPKLNEAKVLAKEKKIVAHITVKQCKNLLKALGNCLN